jgi:ubiquinone/menaquinone biosynthesis C-methylase UbiE
VADLTNCGHIPDETFDCFIFTQTLQFIYETRQAIATIYRILKPGGVLLGTFPALSQVCRYDMDRWGDYWRFTSASIRNLLSEAFGAENVQVEIYGNVLTALCFLHGIAAEELSDEELRSLDQDYPILITARVVKPPQP